ncbi:MAG: hypothetical protein JW909_09655 [Planctomycetes bacterium]|nr:hypothetical protein [Planctomycetota bacterium]
MLYLRNSIIELAVAEDASAITIRDVARDCTWKLDPSTAGVRRYGSGDSAAPAHLMGIRLPVAMERLAGGAASPQADGILVEYDRPEGSVRFLWSLGDDYVSLALQTHADDLEFVSMPGAFLVSDGNQEAALPAWQGVISRSAGDDYEATAEGGGHTCMSMSMAALLADTGGLLVTQESLTDWGCTHGRKDGRPYFFFEARRGEVTAWYRREVRIYPVAPDITSVCAKYRERMKERGEFRTWEEKLDEKPVLKYLFGALIAFLGYNKTDEIDYVESARRLKAYGFDSVMYYSTRMCHYSLDFKMGGDDPIWLTDEEITAMKAIPGTLLSPWVWIIEALDDGSAEHQRIFRRLRDGGTRLHWQIDDYKWYEVCTPYQIQYLKKRLASDMQQMDWLHFDVNAMRPGQPCFSMEHDLHGRKPMSREDSLKLTRELFSAATVGNRIVSSEGFVDRYAAWYDIGSSKIYPAWGDAPFVPVPMTMLVFHDCCVHNWWEVHNYNEHPGFSADDHQLLGYNSCGRPEKKAAMDALYGCPPTLFPFGKQYGWAKAGTKETYSYLVRLEDAEVRRAIKAALPVAKLHGKIGTCRLERFDFVTEDCAVQTTEFSDGTRIVANLSDAPADAGVYGKMDANTWKEVR